MQKFIMKMPTMKEIEVKFFRKLQKQFSSGMVRYLEELDQWILENRDRNRFRMQEFREVTLSTMFGEISFRRRMYRDREKNNYVYLLDQALAFDGQLGVSPHLEEMAVELASKGPSYRDSAQKLESFLGYPALSHETIRERLITHAGKAVGAPEMKRKAEVLFVEVDGLNTKLQRQKRKGIENKIAVVHEGWDVFGKRVRLKHKRHYLHTSKDPFWEGFGDFLIEHYDMDENTWLVVNGDGAPWIGECQAYFHRCIYVLDRFHVIRDLKRYLKGLPQWKAVRKAFDTYDAEALLSAIDAVCIEDIHHEWHKDWERYKAFLHRHREHLKDYRITLKNAGIDTSVMRPMGSAESQMRVMAKRTKGGGYSWTEQGVQAMIQSIMARKEGRPILSTSPRTTDVTEKQSPPFRIQQLMKDSKQAVVGYIDGMIRTLHTDKQSTPLGRALKGLRG